MLSTRRDLMSFTLPGLNELYPRIWWALPAWDLMISIHLDLMSFTRLEYNELYPSGI